MTREHLSPEEIKEIAVGNDWQRIEHDLSEEELREVEREYTTVCLEIDQLELEKKSATSHYGSLIKNSDTRREDLRQQIITKKRSVDTNIYFVPDHEREVMLFFDIKTGVKVKERPLESYERQQSALEDFATVEKESEEAHATETGA
jgi:hypothetical protein